MTNLTHTQTQVTPDIYTDLHSLNRLKTEHNGDIALKKVAQQFESIFVNIMLKSMRAANAVFEQGNFMNSHEATMYRDMHDQQLALSLANGRGLGIAEAMYQQMQGRYGQQLQNNERESTPEVPLTLELRVRNASAVAPIAMAPIAMAPIANTPSVGAISGAPAAPITKTEGEYQSAFSDPQEFIDRLLPGAKKAAAVLGLNPLMMLAQAALETGWGKHLVKSASGNSHNLFNIKADAAWRGDAIAKTTLEYKDGIAVKEAAQFRKYGSFDESFNDFVEFLQRNPRYDNALNQTGDAQAFIQEVHRAGYATDPAYSDKVMAVFEQLQKLVSAEQG